jgi:DNA-binding transcriptional ArsR family regulator
MARNNKAYIIRSAKQLKTLSSAARQEIVDVLAQMGTVSVAELARVLGRAPDALYYHLRILKKEGLIIESRSSDEPGSEALFSSVSSDLRIDYDAGKADGGKNLNRVVSSMLRLGIRDFRSALANPDVKCSGRERELWALRKTGWLRKKDVARVVAAMEHLSESVASQSEDGQLYGITILLTPLSRRRSRSKATRS